ncbi:ABC transporter permease [Pontibacter anaerobius]|uniref:Transport permease protein n=1 Tax=Pontibacter anaerobius TaxID=2993940 RepID=A0ABT3RDS1_9BACT|nr:ABC transporter permease [Pontibacter anaerobius]MCX2740003.1 ABC transporter permease [Pontibacter anaerobius]
MAAGKKVWDWEISAKTSYWDWSLPELWSYRYLLSSLVRRDFLLKYQQTILGPLWILLLPILTLITYVLVFGKLVGISTGETPKVLFYFSGIVLWNLFSDSFTGTSNTFRENARLFSKVYFPRIVMPAAVTSSHFLQFLIQFALLLLLIGYYGIFQGYRPSFSLWVVGFPIAIVLVGVIGFSLGLLFSVLTAKYRDMVSLINLGIRLFMFLTPVIYPLASVPDNLHWIVTLNPLTPLFELFRLGLLGEGVVTPANLIYSLLFAIIVALAALLTFNKQGDKLIDVV